MGRRQAWCTLAWALAGSLTSATAVSSLVPARSLMYMCLRLRGGVKRAAPVSEDKEDDPPDGEEDAQGAGVLSLVKGMFENIPPATRAYVILLLVTTAVDLGTGEAIDTGTVFSLDWGRTVKGLELWRPITSLCFLGPLSMGWLTNLYFLTQHGTRLEVVSGTAEQVIFLLVVGLLLVVLGPLIGMPFVSTSMVAAHTYVSTRMDPLGSVNFQFLQIPLWTLPFAQMGAAVLQEQGQPMAAVPHILGIFCGHIYHFFTVVHPLMGAKRRLGAPNWLKRRLDGENPNFMEPPGGKGGDDDAPRGRKVGSGSKKASSKGGVKLGGKGTKSKKRTAVPDVPNVGSSCCA